jgi:hypothetical protein
LGDIPEWKGVNSSSNAGLAGSQRADF